MFAKDGNLTARRAAFRRVPQPVVDGTIPGIVVGGQVWSIRMADPARIRAVLFDKDGTLVDFDRTWGPAALAVMRRLAGGNPHHLDALLAASHFDLTAMRMRATSPLLAGSTSQYGGLWASALDREPTSAFFAEVDDLFRVEGLRHLTPIGTPRDVVGRLSGHGYRLGIATNDSEIGGVTQAEALGLTPHLDRVIGWDSGFGAKPDPGQVIGFADHVGLPPQAIAMIGDTAHDLNAARAAGAIAVLVLTGPRGRDALGDLAPLADVVLDRAEDVPAWLGLT
jgi:phosphoglycolate phosphatase